MIEDILRKIVEEKTLAGLDKTVIRNFLKEYLHYIILGIIYGDKKWKNLIFNGGTCLRVCFDLPRLSEDLDFDYLKKDFPDFSLPELAKLVENKIRPLLINPDILEVKIQGNFRIYLKFSLLKSLGFASETSSESDKLNVKVEISKEEVDVFGTELEAVNKFNANFMARRFDLPSLMCGKVAAALGRTWFHGKNSEIDIKGRDFYDVFWYLQNKVTPNWKRLKKFTGIKNNKELKAALEKRIEAVVTPEKLSADLSAVFENQQFVEDFAKNYKTLIEPYLSQLSSFPKNR